jgi:phosphate transport system substrate-binding protein
LTVVVHPDLAVDQVTVEELKAIFSEDTKPTNWNEVNPAWPNMEIKIYAPGNESGTYDYFTEAILDKQPIRGDYSPNKDDNALVNSIAGTKGAIGFFGASYYFGNTDKLKALKVVNPKTGKAELPSTATIESGEYFPLSRPLFIYINKGKLNQPQIRVFVEDYLEHAAELAAGVNYVALPEKIYEQAKSNFKAKKAGTHFVDENGNSRSGSLENIFKAENLGSGA